jgi:pilus assembly protein Flp/PilA
MKKMIENLKKAHFVGKMQDETGATMVEYALMLALIAVVCIIAVTTIGTNANAMFDYIATKIVTPAG